MNQVDEREQKRLAAIARYDMDAAPVIDELQALGFDVESVGALYNRKLDYRDTIPLLLKWLPRVCNRDVKEDIIRALSVKWAKGTEAATLLLAEFKTADDPTGSGLRWAIGNALDVLADDSIADDMIALATNRTYGHARQMLVLGLGKLKHPRVPDVLIGLLDDDDVVAHAVDALGKLKVAHARPYLRPLLDHERSVVRREAKRALAKIDKAHGGQRKSARRGGRESRLKTTQALTTVPPPGLAETSMNFDSGLFRPFLERLSGLVGSLGAREISDILDIVEELEPGDAREFHFDVTCERETVPLRIGVLIDDETTLDLMCFTSPKLVVTVEELTQAFFEDHNV